VIAALCTGCELCIAPCPVDCITMVPRIAGTPEPTPDTNRARYHAHNARLGRRAEAQAALLTARKQTAVSLHNQAPGTRPGASPAARESS
jgi:electron transport complex protein RnfB